jgi:hypothetical protein
MAKKPKQDPAIVHKQQPIAAARPVVAQHWFYRFKVQAAIVALLAIICYANTYNNEIAFDDNIVIVKNEYVLEGFAGIHDLLTRDGYDSYYRQFNSANQLSGGRYRPLSLVTFAVEQELFGAVPKEKVDSLLQQQMNDQSNGPYQQKLMRDMHMRHLFNVLWFALSVIVLLYFLRYIVFRNNYLMAFIAAVLFTVHPIHTEVVANVKSRDEIMSLLFICLTFICAFKYREHGKAKWLAMALLSCFLAFLSKEYAITLLVLLPLSFYLFGRCPVRKSLLSTIPYLIVTVFYIFIRLQIVQPAAEHADTNILNNPYAFATGDQKIATEISTSLNYLKLLVFPHPLSFDYSYNHVPYKDFLAPQVWLSLMVFVALAAGFFYFLKRKNVLSFAIAFYLLNLLLVCNIFFDIGATMGERLIYHSSVGFVIAIAYLLCSGAARIRPARTGKMVLATIMGAVVLLSGFTTIRRNADWKNNLTLSFHDLQWAPNSVLVNTNVGIALMNGSDSEKDPQKKNNDLYRAVSLFSKAIAIYGAYDKAYINRSLAYFRLGLLDSVLSDLKVATNLNPVFPQLPDIYYNLGIAFSINKQYDKADTAWATTLRLNPHYMNAQRELGDLRSHRPK